jgi:tRNA G18 (ribose-2'-O)-methylase SpoU
MAVGKLPQEHPLENLVGKLPQPLFIAALDGISQSENVGSIVRNCAAFGVHIVISGETSCSPYLRRAVRNSMGTVFTLEVVHSPNLLKTLQLLKEQYSTSIIAADPHTNTTLDTLNLTGNVCIVFGSEDAGVSPSIMDIATHAAAIPMSAGVDSLNVGSASAVMLYELVRKQKQKQ